MRTSSGGPDSLANVFTEDITDATPGLHVRHTVDVFGGQATVNNDYPVFTTTRVSRYPFGSVADTSTGPRPRKSIQQLRSNPPNLPIFAQFTRPFDGDYNDVAGQTIKATGPGNYSWNFDPNTPVHGTWTTNQDVVTPKDGNWANATPLKLLNSGGTDVVTNAACLPGQEGIQNQNVYTATLFNGIDAYAVVNSKYLNSATPRQFNIVVQNGTSSTLLGVSLAIGTQPPGGTASFKPSGALVLSLSSLNIRPFSSLTRTVWVTSSNPGATVTVNVTTPSTVIPVLLNPDPAATVATASQETDVVNNNQGNVTVINTRLSNAELTDNTLTDNTLTDAELTDNTLTDNTLTDNTLTDNTLTDNNLTDNTLTDNTLTDNNLTDNTLTDNNLTDNTLTDAGLADATFTLFNNGTTDVALNVKALMRGQTIPAGYNVQLIIHKTYNTQMPDLSKRSTGGIGFCGYSKSPQSVAVLNAKNPTITPTGDSTLSQFLDENADAYTLSLLPQEIGRVVFRLVKNGQTIDQNTQAANELGNNGVKMVAVNASTTVVPIPVVIDTLSLPDATTGQSYLSSPELRASGGKGTLHWTSPGSSLSPLICPANSTEGLAATGLSLNDSGLISGMAGPAGLYCFRVQVSDSGPDFNLKLQTDKQTLTLIVHGFQTVAFPAGPLIYGSPLTLSANSSAGLPMTYSVDSGACTVSGNVVSATSGTGTCTVSATQAGDSVYFPLSASNTYTLAKGNQAALTLNAGSPLSFNATETLTTSGGSGTGAVTFSLTSGSCTLSTDQLTANSSTGSCVLQAIKAADDNYNQAPAAATVTLQKASQTITFGALADKVYGDPPFPVSATASSGLAVTFTVIGNCSISGTTVTLTAMGTCSVTAHQGGDNNYLAAPDVTQSFKIAGSVSTGSMGTARSYHTATLLGTGTNAKVLVAGGFNASGQTLASAELYDPVAGTFSPTANNMPNKAVGHTATLLGSGKVLVTGGGNASSELYDPVTNTWSAGGGMSSQRSYHTATLLLNGKVLIAGGSANNGATTNTAQLYNPATGAFTATGNMTVSRDFHTATLLSNGKVLIAGGRTSSGSGYTYASTAELYDPATGAFSAVGSLMKSARFGHTAALINGKVLISGGSNGTVALATAELYDPAAVTSPFFTVTGSLATARQYFTATVFGTSVLAAGGLNGTTRLQSAEQYLGGAFVSAGSMTAPRAAHTATKLNNGKILITGGQGSAGTSVPTAELFGNP